MCKSFNGSICDYMNGEYQFTKIKGSIQFADKIPTIIVVAVSTSQQKKRKRKFQVKSFESRLKWIFAFHIPRYDDDVVYGWV